MAYVVEADSIVEAWIKAVATVYHNGVDLPTEYDNNARTLVDPLVVHINTPWIYPRICDDISPVKSGIIRDYCRKFLTVSDSGHSYTYPNRLFDYPRHDATVDNEYPTGNGKGNGFDQIAHIIRELSKSRISRRQIAHTWNPESDAFMEHCPCLQDVQFSIVFGELRAVAHFRSNDMLDASLSNNNGLHTLQRYVASSLGIRCGYLEVYSAFPHIYENRLDDAKKVLAGANKYLSYPQLVRMYED
jgi:thymidylate synthase (methanogen type)